jgi:hypothetical protein
VGQAYPSALLLTFYDGEQKANYATLIRWTRVASSRSAISSWHSNLARLEDRTQGATLPEETRKGRRKKKKGNPQFNLRQELFRMTGTDLTQIDGIDVMTAMTVVSEVGWDMRFAT